MAITVKDVAALAGVSPSTVSRVCNDSPSISRETKEKVRRAMAQLGYEPTPTAAAPVEPAGVRLIGVILPSSSVEVFKNPFYLEALRGISQYCNSRQYASTLITGTTEDEIISAVRTLCRSGQVEGFILLYSQENDPIVDYLCEQGQLYVMIGKPNQLTQQTICIDNDNLLAGREATEYLYALGHRRIGYLYREGMFLFSSDRKSGYQLALLQNNLPVQPEYCVEFDDFLAEDSEELCALLSREDRPTAMVVSDDILAVALERICSLLNLSIPQDLSIISFNNSLFAQLPVPQLTSIDVNSFQLGFEAASQIINHVENPNLKATKIIVPHHIVERDSCCPPREV